MSERLLRVTKIEELDSGVEITLTDGGSVLKWMVSWEAAATYTFGKSFRVSVEDAQAIGTPRFIGRPQADAIIQEMIDDGTYTPSAEERHNSGGASE